MCQTYGNFLQKRSSQISIKNQLELSKEDIENEIQKIKEKLIENDFSVDITIKNEDAIDSGASLLIYSIDENSIIGNDALWNKKTKDFDLDLDKFINNELGVDEKLADMLVSIASLGEKKTIFHTKKMTKHLETNLFVTSKITGCKYGIGRLNDGFEVIIEGMSYSSV